MERFANNVTNTKDSDPDGENIFPKRDYIDPNMRPFCWECCSSAVESLFSAVQCSAVQCSVAVSAPVELQGHTAEIILL
jgi:hypothetical protein